MHKFIQKIKETSERGMTALELVVVLGIFAAISSTILFNYRNFSNNVALQNLAQDIALQIKQAQTDAVSGKIPVLAPESFQGENYAELLPSNWKPSYGLAFNLEQSGGWDLGGKGFVYYFNAGAPPVPPDPETDRDFYDMTIINYSGCYPSAPADSECLQEINITSGDIIDMICFDFSEFGDTCDGNEGQQAFISFTRPRGNAVILDGSPDDGTTSSSIHGNVYLRLSSPSGTKKFVAVWSSGYIQIK